MGYRTLCEEFLRSCNPFLYGETVETTSPQQHTDLADAIEGLISTARALQEAGKLDESTDPVLFSKVDPRNMWAYAGKLHQPTVQLLLPLIGAELSISQFWMQPPDFEQGGLVDGHTTVGLLPSSRPLHCAIMTSVPGMT